MHVLTISNCPLVHSQGSGYIILGYRDALETLGWHVDLFGPESCELWPKLRLGRSYRLALGMLRLAQRQLQSCAYDIVEFYGGESWLAASMLAQQPKRRHFIVSHSNGLEAYASEMQIRYLGSATSIAQLREVGVSYFAYLQDEIAPLPELLRIKAQNALALNY